MSLTKHFRKRLYSMSLEDKICLKDTLEKLLGSEKNPMIKSSLAKMGHTVSMATRRKISLTKKGTTYRRKVE